MLELLNINNQILKWEKRARRPETINPSSIKQPAQKVRVDTSTPLAKFKI